MAAGITARQFSPTPSDIFAHRQPPAQARLTSDSLALAPGPRRKLLARVPQRQYLSERLEITPFPSILTGSDDGPGRSPMGNGNSTNRGGNTMKRSTLAAVGAILVLGAAPAAAQKQTLRMAYWAGPAHQMVQTPEAWAKTVVEASGGNLTIEIDKAPLAKPEGQYDIIKNGVSDPVRPVPPYH